MSNLNEQEETSGVDSDARISITDVSGTVAKFEMAYSLRKNESLWFFAPVRKRIPSYVFAGISVLFFAAVGVAAFGPSDSDFHRWLVYRDMGRPVSSLTLATLILLSGLAHLISAHLDGVTVTGERIEIRRRTFGFPVVKQFYWSQVHRVIVGPRPGDVMFELWDNAYHRAPPLADTVRFERVAQEMASRSGAMITALK